MSTATYTKLKSGDWGVRVEGAATAGQQITVSKRSGEAKIETIAKVVWQGNGISLCAIQQRSQGNFLRRSAHPRTGCSCGSREGIIQATDCWTCKHDAE